MEKTPVSQRPELLFEVSWEVCNKIGGIYTVLSTKAKTLQKLSKDTTVFIGPDVWSESNPSPWFKECNIPGLTRWSRNAQLPDGVGVRVGRWEIPGRPIAILVKFDGMYAVKDEFYARMWELYGVDSLHAYGDYDEGCAFAHAAGVVIESIVLSGYGQENPPVPSVPRRGRPRKQPAPSVVAHFDEWTTGMGLLYVKSRLPRVATVFTTHATSIGRSICGNNKPLYDYLAGYNGDQMARELNMEAKHSLEKAAAREADIFTTVSDITARECEQLLERRPDVVTPNGFEKNFVPTGPRAAEVRDQARRSMLRVASALTGHHYDDSAFLVISSGRCEYRNKGIDVYLDVAATLREQQVDRKVVTFVMVPAWVKDPRADLRERLASGREYFDTPLAEPVITHSLNNHEYDPIVGRIRQLGFCNIDPRVAVIFVPCYLNGSDGIFNLPYYDLLCGADATVFPSYYEPWGYTPLESIAFGVPTVTTTLSGFGQWILSSFENHFESCGVKVVGRGDSNYGDVVWNIAQDLRFLANADEKTIARVRRAARGAAACAEWSNVISYYDTAYAQALAKAATR